jgi:hypothetical protein
MAVAPVTLKHLANDGGLRIEWLPHGGLRRIDAHGVMVNLFPGNAVEGGAANLWLRRHADSGVAAVPLLGPQSPLQLQAEAAGWLARGHWCGLAL